VSKCFKKKCKNIEKSINPMKISICNSRRMGSPMKRKNTTIIIIMLLISTVFTSVFLVNTTQAAGNEIYVDDSPHTYRDGSAEHPFEHIQHAIDVAENGDTIYVYGGSYNETLTIDKNLTLIGSIEDGDTVISKNSYNRYTVEISVDYVTFEGFTITNQYQQNMVSLLYVTSNNVVIQANNFSNSHNWGIYLANSDDNTIGNNHVNGTKGVSLVNSKNNVLINNIISNSTEAGLYLQSQSHDNIIYGNKIENNTYGIYAISLQNTNLTGNTILSNDFGGIKLYQGTTPKIVNNTINSNGGNGLDLSASNAKVHNNTFYENQVGMNLDTTDCFIYNNTFTSSLIFGIEATKNSVGNYLYRNKFRLNSDHVSDEGSNQWYYEKQGNYWSDYNWVDRNHDGIGDKPYIKGNVRDLYPLGFFLQPPEKPTDPSPEDGEENVGLRVTLEVTVSDPDSKTVNVFFYNALNDELIAEDYFVEDGGRAKGTFNLPFDTTYAWYAIANDTVSQNKSDIWFFITRQRPPENEKPKAVPGGPYDGGIGELIQFNGSGSYDPDGVIDFYRWNFGDGTSEILDVDPTHRYEEAGEYTVTLTVIDNNGSSNIATTKAYISDEPTPKNPISDPGGPYESTAGQQVLLDGSNSSDPDGYITNYSWNFGDQTMGYGATTAHTYEKEGSYLIQLTVTDNQGLTNASQTSINVQPADQPTPGFSVIILICALFVIAFIFYKKRE